MDAAVAWSFRLLWAFLANAIRRLLLGTSTFGYIPPHNLWNPILFARIFIFVGANRFGRRACSQVSERFEFTARMLITDCDEAGKRQIGASR